MEAGHGRSFMGKSRATELRNALATGFREPVTRSVLQFTQRLYVNCSASVGRITRLVLIRSSRRSHTRFEPRLSLNTDYSQSRRSRLSASGPVCEFTDPLPNTRSRCISALNGQSRKLSQFHRNCRGSNSVPFAASGAMSNRPCIFAPICKRDEIGFNQLNLLRKSLFDGQRWWTSAMGAG